MKKYMVNKYFVVMDKGYIIVHLSAEKWENYKGREVKLIVNTKEILFDYVGCGNANGELVIKLIPKLKIDLSILNENRNTEQMYVLME